MLAIALRANYKPETDPGNRVCLAQISTGVKFASSYLQRVLGCVPQAAHPGPVFDDLFAAQEREARVRVESHPLLRREIQVDICVVLQRRARRIHRSAAARPKNLGGQIAMSAIVFQRSNAIATQLLYTAACKRYFGADSLKRYHNTVVANASVETLFRGKFAANTSAINVLRRAAISQPAAVLSSRNVFICQDCVTSWCRK